MPRSYAVLSACALAAALAACSDPAPSPQGGAPTDAGGDALVFGDLNGGADAAKDAAASDAEVAANDAEVAANDAEVADDDAEVTANDAEVVANDAEVADSGPEVVDAGPDLVDAGPDLVDAGPDLVDAGSDVVDAGPAPGVFTPLGCSKLANTNTEGTVNPYISPARNGHFYVSYVAKGGDLMLNWELPTGCKTTFGPAQVNQTKGDVYYWGGIAVVSDVDGNFYAVWESQTKGSEISFAYSETGKSFSAPVEMVSTSTNGQDPAIWVSAPGKVHAAWRGHHATLKQYDPYYAVGTEMFKGNKFSTGVLINSDAVQDDQVAVVTDSKGHVYFAWQTFEGDLFAAKSTDQGKTWSKPVQINDVKGKANVGKATFLAITPDDRVVAIWSDERKAKSGNENDVFADSSADGLTWGTDVQVNDDDARYQEDPSLAVGLTSPCKGVVYAVWQDFRSKKSHDVYAARSVDGGLKWSKNEAVAASAAGDEMNPAIAVDATCVIGVAWRDSTKNPNFDIGVTFLKW